MKTLRAALGSSPEKYKWQNTRNWICIRTKSHGDFYRKVQSVFAEVKKLQKEIGEEEYDTYSYLFEISKEIPRELKQVKHRWPDGFCSLLPDTSDFAKFTKEHIFNGDEIFTIEAGNSTWKLCMEQETPFYFIVRDYSTGGKLPANIS